MKTVNQFIKKSVFKYTVVMIFFVFTKPLFASDIFVLKKTFITNISSGIDKEMIRIKIPNAEYAEVIECLDRTAYATSKKDSEGFDNHRTLLMAAYVSGKEATISVSGCTSDMPKIINVAL